MPTEPAVGTEVTTAVPVTPLVVESAPVVVTPPTPAVDAAAQAAAAEAAKIALKDPTPEQAPAPTVAYEPTGDPGLDLALDFVGKLNIDDQHPAMVAALNGDFTLIKATLGAMGDKAKGWENFVALAERSFASAQTEAANKASAIQTAVHTAVGGVENWNAITVWAAKEATPAEKTEINAMFDAGPTQARAAAIMLQNLYNAKANKSPASAVRPGATGGEQPNQTGSLNRRELVREIDALRNRIGGHNLEASPEYKALHARLRK